MRTIFPLHFGRIFKGEQSTASDVQEGLHDLFELPSSHAKLCYDQLTMRHDPVYRTMDISKVIRQSTPQSQTNAMPPTPLGYFNCERPRSIKSDTAIHYSNFRIEPFPIFSSHLYKRCLCLSCQLHESPSNDSATL